ncbi:MAG: HU family DNA-binding protein [Desulfobacterales bacterium]|nr:HU family DNA-binding protein [Desulfofustis sp.]NNK93343.1 HU family DNA-binding protein [Desulfobacterales bacterium]
MTKTQLMEKIAKDAGVTKTAAKQILTTFLDTISNELVKEDGKVTLSGFGTLSTIQRQERKGRNPQTGETVEIKASNTVKFKPAKALKDSV